MKVMIHCCLCDKEEEVEESEATDYICDECKDFHSTLFGDAVHETEKMFRRKAEFRDSPNVHVALGLMPSEYTSDD